MKRQREDNHQVRNRMKTGIWKSPAFRAGLLSNKAFVKRDAEPSECECSLGEFIAVKNVAKKL